MSWARCSGVIELSICCICAGRRLDTDVGLWEAGVERRATLVEDAARVRALLDDLLGEMPQREK
jgi:hypothetical protein